MSDKHYFMVRAMKSEDTDFDILFGENVIAVGWSDVNFTNYENSETLREAVRLKCYASSKNPQSIITKKLNEVVRFKNIREGDYIIVPNHSNVVLAIAESEEIYSPDAFDRDLSNQRKVTYRYSGSEILRIPRSELSEGLQRRLRVRGTTVSDLFEFRDEIEHLFDRRSYSYSQEMQDREQEEREMLKKGILFNIQKGKTNLKTGGIGLEDLVCELMKCEGYDARVLAKTKFSGKADADILAMKDDAFMSKKIFVQVKHHSGVSGKEGIQQVIDVLRQEEYLEYEGYFVTSAAVDEDTRKFGIDNGIEVMDGEALVDLIINNLNKLSPTTIRLLGISPYPNILTVI